MVCQIVSLSGQSAAAPVCPLSALAAARRHARLVGIVGLGRAQELTKRKLRLDGSELAAQAQKLSDLQLPLDLGEFGLHLQQFCIFGLPFR